jgi:hypothetical protein
MLARTSSAPAVAVGVTVLTLLTCSSSPATAAPAALDVPAVTMTAPTAGAYVPARFTTSVTAAAPSRIRHAVVYVDGRKTATDRRAPYTAVVDLTGRSGTVTVAWKVTSTNGRITTVTRKAVVDGTAPVLAWSGPASGSLTGATALTVTASDGGGIAGLAVTVDGVRTRTTRSSHTFTVVPGSGQAVTVQVTATDRAGNTTTGTRRYTKVSGTGSPAPDPGPPGGPGCPAGGYPTSACTGVPAGWVPKTTINGDLTITTAGATITDHLVTGNIYVKAAGVTITRTRVYGVVTNDVNNRVYGPLTLNRVEVTNPPGRTASTDTYEAIGPSHYTCTGCKIWNRVEGFRVGAVDLPGAGPVTIQDSYVQTLVTPELCAAADPHGDGLQAYGGGHVTLRHNVIDVTRDSCGTSPVFIPDQGNSGATVVDNILAGGGYALRLTGGVFPAVTGNKIVDGSWAYGPVAVDCGRITTWSGNAVIDYDFTTGTPLWQVRPLTDCGR